MQQQTGHVVSDAGSQVLTEITHGGHVLTEDSEEAAALAGTQESVVAAAAETDALERAVDPPVSALVAGGGVDVEVLAAGEVAVEARLLDDRPDARQRRRAVAGEVVAEQEADERGLAGAVGAEEAEGDAARDLEVDAVEGRPLAEALAEAARLDGESGGGGGVHASQATGARAACRRAPG